MHIELKLRINAGFGTCEGCTYQESNWCRLFDKRLYPNCAGENVRLMVCQEAAGQVVRLEEYMECDGERADDVLVLLAAPWKDGLLDPVMYYLVCARRGHDGFIARFSSFDPFTNPHCKWMRKKG